MFNSHLVNLTANSGGNSPASTAVPAAPVVDPKAAAPAAPVVDPKAPAAPAAPAVDLKTVLAKHGLADEKALESYLESLSGIKSQLGDKNLDDLLKAQERVQQIEQERARAEREQMKANETPEQTIARLEAEMDKQNRQSKRQAESERKSQAAQAALSSYGSFVDSALSTVADFPQEYAPIVKSIMGVDSDVNDLDITDRNSVFSLTQKIAKNVMQDFANAVINRYRAGKEALPTVPAPSAGGEPGGRGETQPKSLNEAHALARSMMAKHFMNRG